MEGDESRMMLVGATGFDEKGGIDETKQREFEEAKFETECKNEEREGRETGKEEPEAIETRMEGVGPEKVIGGKIEVSKEGVVKGITQKEIEDQDKERVKDIFGGTQKREIQKVESETGGANEERVGTETSKVGLEAMDTTMEGGESEMALVGSIRGSEAAKFEIEEKDEEFVGIENNEKGLEATESKMEGGESKKLLDGKIGVNEEDIVEAIEQREIDETKFEIEDRDKEKVEVFKGTLEKEIEKNEFAIEGKDEERVATEITEEFEAKGTAIEEGVLEKFLSSATRVTGKDIIEGTKKGEDYVPKFENENRDEEISNDEFEARKTKIEESPKQEPKLPVQLEESEGTFEGIESGEDKSEGAKQKEIEGPKFLDVEENSKIPKCATSQGSNLEGIEEAKQAMAKRGSEEAEGFLEKVEGEEPLKISEIASKVIGNDNARNSGKKEIEESANRSSGDGPQVRENIVRDMFEELGTDTAKFPGQITETKARREKEVKVKEDIIVKRERYVRVKEEMIVSKYDEAKEGFEKATTRDKIQLENGLPGDDRGFDEETLGAARWDKTKALKEGCVETEPSAEKVKGESNDNVQGEVFSPSMKDNTRERIEKETEDPMVGTKQKAQHHVQELPMKIAESLDEGEGPKETKTEEMKEAKRKSEETQVVADKESAVEEKIREAEIERIGKIKQFETALQEVPGAEDPKELGKGMREIESMLSTSEVKEIDKICEECKRSEASLEREKHRKTQNVKDDKATRENAVNRF
ncbi:uncharacterized protein LOC129292717 [Prosopis cineraria]|uniref:uncharacterized protein LOC129292717 n=1 Tax=Prosopis cineraria TaxID=364024 RepID=UPI0024106F46|nr:uncharacterized protein LOC129292717 [Prosopis cineraria]